MSALKLVVEIEGKTPTEIAASLREAAAQLDGVTPTGLTSNPKAARGRPAKAIEPQDTEETEETENDDAFGSDDEEEETTKYTKEEVLKAVNTYYKKHGKEKAMKVLTKFKVKSVHDLKPAHYSDVMALVA